MRDLEIERGSLTESPWPKDRCDRADSALGPHLAGSNQGREVWRFDLKGGLGFPPLIGPDDTVYVCSQRERPVSSTIHALHPDGRVKWSWKVGTWCYRPPVIDAEGRLYLPGENSRLYALSLEGTLIWEAALPHRHVSGCTLTPAGLCIAVGRQLLCLTPTGQPRWAVPLGAEVGDPGQCPAVTADGTLLVGTAASAHRAMLFAVSPDGQLAWKHRFGSCPVTQAEAQVVGSPWVLPDGRPCVNVRLDRLDDVGETARIFSPGGSDLTSLRFPLHGAGPGGTLFACVPAGARVTTDLRLPSGESVALYGPTSHHLRHLTADLRSIWEVPVGRDPRILCTSADGVCCVAARPESSDRTEVHAIAPDGEFMWAVCDPKLPVHRAAISRGGTVYLGVGYPLRGGAYVCAIR